MVTAKGQGAFGLKDKNKTRLTKKAQEEKTAAEKLKKDHELRRIRLKELDIEIEEMKKFLRDEVNNPAIKRRHSYHAYLKIESSSRKNRNKNEEDEDEGELPSMFDDNVAFDEYIIKKEEKRQC